MSQGFLRRVLHFITQSPLQYERRKELADMRTVCGIRGSLRGAHEDSSFMGRSVVPLSSD